MIETNIEKSTSMEMIARANGDKESNSTEIIEEDKLKSTNFEMGRVREENQRLKQLIKKLVEDYHLLQEKFYDIQQEESKKSEDKAPTNTYQEKQDADMVSLSLGIKPNSESNKVENKEHGQCKNEQLALELDCEFEPKSVLSIKNLVGSEATSQVKKEEGHTEIWPPNKVLKTKRSGDDEAMQQSQLKKPRVCVKAKCDTPVMNDGCQWRKYGQKLAKGNPCPRAYYRCTLSANCPVRKQVQRCAEDRSILITTYEGTHNHAIPISATAMAFTTSAAASMLQSRTSSSTSQLGLSGSTSLSAPMSMSTTYNSSPHNIRERNFSFSENSSRSSPQFSFPNSTISTLNSHPTITLDLTAPTNSYNFNRLPCAKRYSPTCLNFSSSSSSSSPYRFGYLNYGVPSNTTNQHGLINLTRQPFVQKNNTSTQSQQSLTGKIAAATKVIATNSSFKSTLAVALTSYVNNNGGVDSKNAEIEGSCLNLKL